MHVILLQGGTDDGRLVKRSQASRSRVKILIAVTSECCSNTSKSALRRAEGRQTWAKYIWDNHKDADICLSWLSHRQKPGGRLCSSDQWGINLRITSRAADNNLYVKLRLDTFSRKKVRTYGLKIWPIRMKNTVFSTAGYFHVALRAAQLAMASLLPQYSSCLATSCKWRISACSLLSLQGAVLMHLVGFSRCTQ